MTLYSSCIERFFWKEYYLSKTISKFASLISDISSRVIKSAFIFIEVF